MAEEHFPIMVLVTLQASCARLIRKGADMAMKRACPLKVVYVSPLESEEETTPPLNAQTLDYLYALAGEASAEMCVLKSQVAVVAMADYAQRNGIRQIIMGGGENAHSIAETLSGLLPGVQVLIVEEEA